MLIGASLPILNQSYDNLPRLAAAAEEAGLDSVWSYEFYRNPFTIHALSDEVTSRITLGIGIAETVARTPFEMANGAADVDELSAGRTILGMGTGGGGLEMFHGLQHVDRPVTRMREFTEAVKQSWRHHSTGEAVSAVGSYHSMSSPPINPCGVRPLARPSIGPVSRNGLRAATRAGVIQRLIATPNVSDQHSDRGAVDCRNVQGKQPQAADAELASASKNSLGGKLESGSHVLGAQTAAPKP